MPLIEELREITTGIYVLTVREGDLRHGMSSSWVTQVSGEPPLLVAAVDREHFTHGILERTRVFGLNVVGKEARHLEDYFYSPACRKENNLEGLDLETTPSGVPLLRDAMVAFECAVEEAFPAGDHTLFVAAVRSVRTPERRDVPLTSQDLEYVYLGTGKIVRR